LVPFKEVARGVITNRCCPVVDESCAGQLVMKVVGYGRLEAWAGVPALAA
jgi:hypothetical protein